MTIPDYDENKPWLDAARLDAQRQAITVYGEAVTLTDAEIKALPTTGVIVVAGAGEGKIIFPFYAIARLDWVADYTNIDSQCQLRFLLGAGADALIPFRQDIASGVSGILAGSGPDASIGWTPTKFLGSVTAAPGAIVIGAISGLYDSDLVNFPLSLKATNGSAGDFTGGDEGNSLRITVLYTIVDI